MKKIVFGILCLLSLVLLIRIVRILLFDWNRLTDYGMGYLTGSILLFLLLAGSSFWLGRKISRKAQNSD